MVVHLAAPTRPLRGGRAWTWRPDDPWFRVYHADPRTPDALTARRFGPLLRFDPHTPPVDSPAECPAGRSAIYLAQTLRTTGAEVFGDFGTAPICPAYRVARVRPTEPATVQDLRGPGSMLIGGLPAMSTADLPRAETQAWARAIYEDRPADAGVCGIRYSGAHDEGACLVLWDAAPPLEVARRARRAEDYPILDAALFRRFVTVMSHLDIDVAVIDASQCVRCRQADRPGRP